MNEANKHKIVVFSYSLINDIAVKNNRSTYWLYADGTYYATGFDEVDQNHPYSYWKIENEKLYFKHVDDDNIDWSKWDSEEYIHIIKALDVDRVIEEFLEREEV